MDNKLITVQEAAKIGNVTEGYIRRMLIHDKFNDLKRDKDYHKLGKVWVISRSAWEKHVKLLELLKSQRQYKKESMK